MNPVSQFLRGASAPLRGAALLLRVPDLRRRAFRPLVINILVFLVGLPLAVWGALSLVGSLLSGDGTWMTLGRTVAQVVAVAAVVLATPVLFIVVGGIIAGPFNSALAVEIERRVRGSAVEDDAGFVAGIRRSIGAELARLGLVILVVPLIWLMNFIPVAGGLISGTGSLLFGAHILALDLSDPVFERHVPHYPDRRRYIARHRPWYLGFGLVAFAMAIIPLVNLIVLPAAVAGGTLLYLEIESGKTG